MKIEERDLVLLLQHLQPEIPEDVRDAARPALIAWRFVADAGERQVAVLLHDFGGFGFQNGIGVVADEPVVVAHAVDASPVRDRTRSRCGRAQTRTQPAMPYAGEIRDQSVALNGIACDVGRRILRPRHHRPRCDDHKQDKNSCRDFAHQTHPLTHPSVGLRRLLIHKTMQRSFTPGALDTSELALSPNLHVFPNLTHDRAGN